MRYTVFSIWFLLVVSVLAQPADRTVAISNGIVSVRLDATMGTFEASCGSTTFLEDGRLSDSFGTVRVTRVNSPFGAADAVEYQYPNGSADCIILYPELPYVALRSTVFNPARDTLIVEKKSTARFATGLGIPLKQLRILGCDRLTGADTSRSGYAFLEVVEPVDRRGIVAGWLSHDRGSGIVSAEPDGKSVRISASTEYGKLRIAPGQRVEGEILLVGYFADAFGALETYADAIAQYHRIKLPPIPKGGHCTWPAHINGRAGTEEGTAKLAGFCGKELIQYGLEFLQLDDYWQNGPDRSADKNRGPRGDFTTHRIDGPYPKGMKPTADFIKSNRIVPGIWLLPFAWDRHADVLKNHLDWFVHKADGSIFETRWAGDCLDMTHPAAVQFLKETVSRITKQWGYQYIKIDGLYSGMAVENLYTPVPKVLPDSLGQAVFHNPGKTNVEAFRDGLKAVREAAGADVYILGCTSAQNYRAMGAAFGLVDAMRIGRDVNASWKGLMPAVDMASRLYFLHNRVWHNDPDHLMLREPLTLDQARAWGTWITVTGQLNLCGEYFPALPPERLDIVKRSIPNTGLCGRPLDLFDGRRPQIWQLTDDRNSTRRDVLGLFNWNDQEPQDVSVDLSDLHIPSNGRNTYAGFDYWENRFVGPFQDRIEFRFRPSSCKSIAIRSASDFPQVISTSRHIAQGMVDLKEETWNPKTRNLSGIGRVVAGDPYEIRVFMPASGKWGTRISATVSAPDEQAGVKVRVKRDGNHYRIALASPENRDVAWKLNFRRD